MSWTINMRGVKRIRSYQEALEYFNETKPFRGSSHRPVGDRRAKHKSMYMRNNGSEAISFRLYRTDLITFLPDGQVVFDFYSSNSSHEFLNCFMPRGISLKSVAGRMVVETSAGTYTSGTPLTFKPENDGWVLTNPHDACVFKKEIVCRKKLAKVGATYKAFKRWVEVYFKLTNGKTPSFDKDEVVLSVSKCLSLHSLGTPMPSEEYSMLLTALVRKCQHDRCFGLTPNHVLGELSRQVYDFFSVVETRVYPVGELPPGKVFVVS